MRMLLKLLAIYTLNTHCFCYLGQGGTVSESHSLVELQDLSSGGTFCFFCSSYSSLVCLISYIFLTNPKATSPPAVSASSLCTWSHPIMCQSSEIPRKSCTYIRHCKTVNNFNDHGDLECSRHKVKVYWLGLRSSPGEPCIAFLWVWLKTLVPVHTFQMDWPQSSKNPKLNHY